MPNNQYAFNDDLRRSIEHNLTRFEHRTIEDETLRRAAVVVVVAKGETNDSATMILTYRPGGMRRHAHQYALPGGRSDEGETTIQTALRELHEELRVELDPADVLGFLDDYPTMSGFAITPIVAWANADLEIDPDPVEVEKVFRIPFSELDSTAIPHLTEEKNGEPPVLFSRFPTLGHRMYAPTAAMVYQFREVAIRGLDTRVAHYGQPEFAWK